LRFNPFYRKERKGFRKVRQVIYFYALIGQPQGLLLHFFQEYGRRCFFHSTKVGRLTGFVLFVY
jgi:hypothetical protein